MNIRLKKHVLTLLTVAAAVLGLPAAAAAHVTLQPSEQPAGAFVRADVRVPNELDNASTEKVEVQFPAGFLFASYEPVAGWKAKITREKLDKPVTSPEGGEPITEQVKQVTFTADSNSDGIKPGQFQDFGLSTQMPDKAGTALTFKAIQTYSNGKVVRWIGAPDTEEPAPQVRLVSADESAPAPAPAASTSSSDDDASKGLGIAALVVGALGLLAGGAALIMSRRRRT
jgi:periplasmic copper chaperone A